MRTKIRRTLSQVALVAVALLFSVGIQALAASWAGPTAAPPGNNTPAPLNVGSTGQTKAGPLVVNSSGSVSPGLLVNSGITVSSGDVTVAGKIGTSGFSPTSGYPSGWGGGVHTWDVYAQGTVGAGPSGGPLKAYLNSAGDIGATGSITAGGVVKGGDVCTTAGKCLSSVGGGSSDTIPVYLCPDSTYSSGIFCPVDLITQTCRSQLTTQSTCTQVRRWRRRLCRLRTVSCTLVGHISP